MLYLQLKLPVFFDLFAPIFMNKNQLYFEVETICNKYVGLRNCMSDNSSSMLTFSCASMRSEGKPAYFFYSEARTSAEWRVDFP